MGGVNNRLADKLGVEAEGGVGELIARANDLLEIEACGSLKQQAEAALAALLGEEPPASSGAGDGPAGSRPTCVVANSNWRADACFQAAAATAHSILARSLTTSRRRILRRGQRQLVWDRHPDVIRRWWSICTTISARCAVGRLDSASKGEGWSGTHG